MKSTTSLKTAALQLLVLVVAAASYFAASPKAALAQLSRIVTDLDRGLVEERPSASVDGLRKLGSRALFTASANGDDVSLWSTDGTAAGTLALPLSCSETCRFRSGGEGPNGSVFWWTVRERLGPRARLYLTDGTVAGTIDFGEFSNVYRFGPTDLGLWIGSAWNSSEIVVTDGTRRGTATIDLGTTVDALSAVSLPLGIAFTHTDGDGKQVWWFSAVEQTPRKLYEADHVGLRIFRAGDKLVSAEWTSGALRLNAIDPSTGSLETLLSTTLPSNFIHEYTISLNGRFAFTSDSGRRLFVTDGTPSGTREITVPAGPQISNLVLTRQRLYFGVSEPDGRSLWYDQFDGNPPKRFAFLPTRPNHTPPMERSGRLDDDKYLFWENGELFVVEHEDTEPILLATSVFRQTNHFRYQSPFYFRSDGDLWRTNGTPDGTRLVAERTGELIPSEEAVALRDFDLFVSASHDNSSINENLYRASPLTAPEVVREIRSRQRSGSPFQMSAAGEHIYFTRDTNEPPQLYRSAGSEDSTDVVPLPGQACAGTTVRSVVTAGEVTAFACGQRAFFTKAPAPGEPDFLEVPIDGPANVWPAGAQVLFLRPETLASGRALWATDGTPAGTLEVLPGGPPGSRNVLRTRAASPSTRDLSIFVTDRLHEDFSPRLWHIDPATLQPDQVFTEAGNPLYVQSEALVQTHHGAFYFIAWEWINGGSQLPRLYRIEGHSPTVARRIDGIVLGELVPRVIGSTGDRLLIQAPAPSPETRRGSGPRSIDLPTTLYGFDPLTGESEQLTSASSLDLDWVMTHDGRLLGVARFADFEDIGFLWLTDGTADGSRFVRWPNGDAIYEPTDLVVDPSGRQVFFSGYAPGTGRELLAFDVASDEVQPVHDIFPGLDSSNPRDLVRAGDQIFFSADDGIRGRELHVLPLDAAPGICSSDNEYLCLQQERFRVEVSFPVEGAMRSAATRHLSRDTGAFWFFDRENLELAVKVLDGTGLNGAFWLFYGALSDLEYHLTVTDSLTGAAKRYFNARGVVASVGDTRALSEAAESALVDVESGIRPQIHRVSAGRDGVEPQSIPESCVTSDSTLCLNEGRFAVSVIWQDFLGAAGEGKAIDLERDSGGFWFFDPESLELVVKVLDGVALNEHFWVFYGSLSNVAFDLQVQDLETGESVIYTNSLGSFGSVVDTTALQP